MDGQAIKRNIDLSIFLDEERQHAPSLGQVAGEGGWGSVTDFCYLSNKFFPTPEILELLKEQLPYVIKTYPSMQSQQVKLVKFQGPFVWHYHENEDELFLVVKGRFRMEFRDRHVWLEEGEFLVVPRGVEHRPVADTEAHVLLFEPASTLNTGNVRNERTVKRLEKI